MIKTKKNIFIAFIFGIVVFSGTVFSLNTWNTGYKLLGNGSEQLVTFNKDDTSSATSGTTDMYVYSKNTNDDMFIGTKTNAEFSSFATNTPPDVYMYRIAYSVPDEYTCHNTWSVGCMYRLTDDKTIYVPANGKYRFYLYTERENTQDGEDFELYIDLNKDGDYDDTDEFIFESNDRSQEGKSWEWARENDSLTSTKITRDLTAGNYNFRMKKGNSALMSVDIYRLRLYTY